MLHSIACIPPVHRIGGCFAFKAYWVGVNDGLNANLDFRMTKQSFAKGTAKTIPVVSAVISGGLTFATFPPMAKRLQKHLAGLALAKPCGVPNTTDTGITPA